MTLHIPFDNTYAGLGSGFYSKQAPEPVSSPRMLAFNRDLAQVLGITPGDLPEMAQVFGGNRVPEGAVYVSSLLQGGAVVGFFRSAAVPAVRVGVPVSA